MERNEINLATLAENLRTADATGFVCPATSGSVVTLYELGEILGVTKEDDGAYEIDLTRGGLREQVDPGYLTSNGIYKPCAAAGCNKCYTS